LEWIFILPIKFYSKNGESLSRVNKEEMKYFITKYLWSEKRESEKNLENNTLKNKDICS
jgi:hypothetical protein